MAMKTHARFGDQTPFCEPAWYQGKPTPYFHEGHVAHRNAVRAFCEKEITPNVERWIKEGGYPHKELHQKAFKAKLVRRPKEFGGTDDFDAFYELIMLDELTRAGRGCNVLEQVGINSMALPPILRHGSKALVDEVYAEVTEGRKNICLAISEPGAGSDVANIQCKAVTDPADPNYYIVTGYKKWITGGMIGDWFTTAVRTGGPGMGGISLLCIPRESEGLSIRKMPTQFDGVSSTTFLTFKNVRVHKSRLIGKEGKGFNYIVVNFNHERLVIAAEALRGSRELYREAFHYCKARKTFGKRLMDHQIIRYKLAEMARQIEALQDFVERVASYFAHGIPDAELGGHCALLKVQASKCFEYCAREASQIFGGSAIVREGKGIIVERLYRRVKATAIPGGSEEILLDFAIRQADKESGKL
eukprot:TRINITY_DN4534_c0_g1_i1.p1 TRINITY_DN4534_c0_g1~~TRINITY_DN4534_c0_g1_i1.p1  ORF type:complete len:417 (+),score=159.24 TRINITY_DN4534_c0_g1_i1:46-1296(+)